MTGLHAGLVLLGSWAVVVLWLGLRRPRRRGSHRRRPVSAHAAERYSSSDLRHMDHRDRDWADMLHQINVEEGTASSDQP